MCSALPYGSKCAQPYFTVAITAIHWSALTGFKRYFSFLATLGAHCREHLASGGIAMAIITIAIIAVAVLSCFPGLTAFGTTLGLVCIASRLELFLFLSAKGKSIPAIGTFECLVFKSHWMTSSLTYSSWCLGHPILKINNRNF